MAQIQDTPEAVEAAGPPPAPPADGRARTGAAAGVALAAAVLGALVWGYWPVFRWLWAAWTGDPNYSHGFLVIPVAALIVWSRRGEGGDDGDEPARPWRWAWGLLALVLGARAFFYERGNLWAEAVTMLPALACLILTYGGLDLLRRAWPGVAYLIFMIPLPARLNLVLAQPLQSLATAASREALRLSGLWVISEGNVLYVGKQPLEVATACNGLSMLMSLSATVVAAVLLVPMAAWLRAVLTLSAVPVALTTNVLRIVATAWCYHRLGAEAGARVAHDAAGWLMMPTALVLVGLELWLINRLVVVEETAFEPLILGRPIARGVGRDAPAPGTNPGQGPAADAGAGRAPLHPPDGDAR